MTYKQPRKRQSKDFAYESIRSKDVGFSYITLDSTPEGVWLYERNGFCSINSEDNILFSPYKHEFESIPMYLFLDEE